MFMIQKSRNLQSMYSLSCHQQFNWFALHTLLFAVLTCGTPGVFVHLININIDISSFRDHDEKPTVVKTSDIFFPH